MRFPTHGFVFYATDDHGFSQINRIRVSSVSIRGPNMIAPKDSIEPQTSDAPLPNSPKVYAAGSQHPDLRVPFREISLAPTKTVSGEIEVNEPVRVYDTSGHWGDPAVALDVEQGLPPLRADWIRARGDVEEIEGRAVRPQDNGYLSEKHAAGANGKNGNLKSEIFNLQSRRPLRARG